MNDVIEQDYLDETADELTFYANEIESRLELYGEGKVDEEHVVTPAERANEVYEELDSALDEVSKVLRESNIIDQFRELLEEHGYNSGAQFLAGDRPLTASSEDPERQVFEDLRQTNWPDTSNAYNAANTYMSARQTAMRRHDLELPRPDVDISSTHSEAVEHIRNGMSPHQARKKVKDTTWEEELAAEDEWEAQLDSKEW